jgi:hypothetical protein
MGIRKEWLLDGLPENPRIEKYVAHATDPNRCFVSANVGPQRSGRVGQEVKEVGHLFELQAAVLETPLEFRGGPIGLDEIKARHDDLSFGFVFLHCARQACPRVIRLILHGAMWQSPEKDRSGAQRAAQEES